MKVNTAHLTMTALFVALILLFGLTPVGLISVFGMVNVTILCIPVIVGTLLMGLKSGLILGAFFGLASALSAFGISMAPPSQLAGTLVAANPLLALVMCFVPRLTVPVVTYFTYRLFAGGKKHASRATPIAAIAGSLTNTVLYLGMMVLFYMLSGLDTAGLIGWIVGTGIVAGSTEAAVAAILSTPILAALWKVSRRKLTGKANEGKGFGI